MTDFVKKLFQICCLNQDHSNPDISNTNLATHFKKLQFCAILQSFPYEEGTKLEPFSFPSYGPNQYSPPLQKHMHKIWGRMRPASYCYLVSICINSFSDSVLFAKFIWLPTSGRGDFSITRWAPFPGDLSFSFRAKECAQWSSSNQQNRHVPEELQEV